MSTQFGADWESFEIHGNIYLAIANNNLDGVHHTDSDEEETYRFSFLNHRLNLKKWTMIVLLQRMIHL
jgi:hypothetical protein